MKELTQRQQEILNYLKKHFQENGYWPSIRETQKQFKFKSTNAVMGHLKALQDKGMLKKIPGHARAFKVETSATTTVQEEEQPKWNSMREIQEESILSIPIYGSIAAGYPDRVESSGAIGNLQLDIETSGIRNRQKSFALKVRGESMIDAGIYEGDIVVLEATEPHNNDIVAALIDGETTLKRYIYANGGPAYLKAENPDYPSLHPANELVIQGVARSIVRNL